MKYVVQINKCTDPRMWYRGKMGEFYEVLGKPCADGFPVRASDGFRNYVRVEDCTFYQAMPIPLSSSFAQETR